MTFSKTLKWLLPILLFVLIAPWSPQIDAAVSGYFYSIDRGGFSKAFHHTLIYKYAVYPALFVAISSAFGFIGSFWLKPLWKWRWPFFFCAASMALGAGFFTHAVFKECFFRPRPLQTSLFNGPHLYRPFYALKFNFPNNCKSFPSGHATMGFYFINLIMLGKRLKNTLITQAGIYLTVVMSLILCYSRIAQGAHFFTDVWASMIMTLYPALLVDKLTFNFLAKHPKFQLNFKD